MNTEPESPTPIEDSTTGPWAGALFRIIPFTAICCVLAAGVWFVTTSSDDASEPALTVPAADKADDAEGRVSFNRDIRPILSDKCFACHGPDAKVAKDAGGFRLDIREGAIAPAEASGKVPVVPGDANASELIKRVISDKPNLQMPPPKSKMKLSEQEVGLLKRWIDQGAEYEGHWAYQTPVKPEPPKVVNEDWVRSNIDRFIAKRLEQAGLSPAAEADRETLIRRLSLDLIGLPPTPEQIDAFVNDQSPDAYEKLVDRLLASPHYGERQAIVWMDASRYGDTNGFHHDNIRTAWPWRQWVIEAYNQNMPYDQFVTWQLAGDLLPNATRDQILASAFCRMHNINDEGGALNDEYLVEAHADRIETIATVFMAQTFNCARCHDHKYDPTTQDDYYSLVAYFNSIEGERGVYRNNRTEARAYPPFMQWKSDELLAQLAELKPKVEAAKAAHEKAKPAMTAQYEGMKKTLADQASPEWVKAELESGASSFKETTVQVDKKAGTIQLGGKVPDTEDITLTLKTDATGLRLIKLDAMPVRQGGRRGKDLLGRSPNGNVVLTGITVKAVSIKDPAQSQAVELVAAAADYEQKDGDYDILNALRDDKLGWAIGGHLAPGTRTALFASKQPFGFEGGTKVEITLKHQSVHAKHTLAKVKLDLAKAGEAVLAAFPGEAKPGVSRLQPLALINNNLLPKDAQDRLFEDWLTVAAPEVNQLAKDRAALEKQLLDLENQAVPVLIMKESAPKPAYILARGAYDKPIKERLDEAGETVHVEPQKRKPPMMVDLPLPEGAPDNRLGFAQWLTQPNHPLTSRVHVNRVWKMLFGTGIVATIEDFGSQAEWPSHPRLLDYLAVQFVESGWDQKALVKQIVMSATYRQKATTNSDSIEIDPDNRLLSYFPRRRLPAELIRDNALFISGLMNDQIGGPSVKPYQPGDLWNEVAIGGTNTGRFQRDTGEKLYRRSLYTFWKRTSPPAQMATFNAPTREFCVVIRDNTNTPLQALVLWNDEQFLEAARALAQRTVAEAEADDARLSLIFRRCTGQSAGETELAILRDTLAYYRERYGTAPEDAKALLSQGEHPLPEKHDPAELASWMMVASSVLSLDATIVRD